jgi:plasmid stability protein
MAMASLTIRNLDENVKRALRIRAAARGVSMEEEARRLLVKAVVQPSDAAAAMSHSPEDKAKAIMGKLAFMRKNARVDPDHAFTDQKTLSDLVSDGE